MLHVHEDDPERRRLVLRARAPAFADVARRVLATLLALSPLALALTLHGLGGWPRVHLAWLLPQGVAAALYLATRFTPQLVELGFDGAEARVWSVERGYCIWGLRRRSLALGDALPLAFRGGLLTRQPSELGVVLELEGRAWTEPFSVEGLDRRDDLRRLVERVALRLGRRVLRQRDDLERVRYFCGREGEQPSAAGDPRGYRDATTDAPLTFTPRRGFDLPSTLPPTLEVGTHRWLVHELEVGAAGELTLTRAPAPGSSAPWVMGAGSLLAVLGILLIQFQAELAPPRGAGELGQAFVFFGSVLLVLGVRSHGARFVDQLGRGLRRGLRRALGLGPLSLPAWGMRRPQRVTLRASTLELELAQGPLRLERADLVLVTREHLGPAKRREDEHGLVLALLAGGRWYALASGRPGDFQGRGASELQRVGFEIARALDAPLRVSTEAASD